MPVGIQLRRTKGWRLPPMAVNVARPTRWCNPYKVERNPAEYGGWTVHNWDADMEYLYLRGTRQACIRRAVAEFEQALNDGRLPYGPADVRQALAGRDLACWCPLVDEHGNHVPCHRDVLLKFANPSRTGDE